MAPDFQRTYNPTYSSLVWCTYQVFLLNTFVQYVDVFGIFIPILFREHPRVKRNSSTARLLHVSAVSGVGVDQGASHPVQTIVFTHTGEPHKMEMVVISYDPQGCRLVSQSVPVLYLRIHFYIYCAPIWVRNLARAKSLFLTCYLAIVRWKRRSLLCFYSAFRVLLMHRPFHMVENLDQGRPWAVQRLILPKLLGAFVN